jgi:hypothetical protein
MAVSDNSTKLRFDALNNLRSSVLYSSINIWWVIIGVPVAMIGLMTMFLTSSILADVARLLLILILPGISLGVFLSNLRLNARNQEVLRAFAADNNMAFDPGGGAFLEAGTVFDRTKVGTLFEVGDSKKTANILSGTLQNLPFQLFKYSYETGSGRSRQTHVAMVFEFKLPRVLPQFVIDSQIENVLPIAFDRSQKIELEGDFHKYFDLYAPDTYGISALTLLAPDVMETLLEYAALCDIEVIQDKLLFYWSYAGTTRKQYEQVFLTVDAVIKKLGDKLTNADIFGTPSQAQIHANPSSSGVRLKKSKFGLLFGLAIIVYICARLFLETQLVPLGAALIAILSVTIILWVIISSLRQTSLKNQYLRRYKSK